MGATVILWVHAVPQNHSGGLYGPTTSLWWPAWTHKITVACGGLHGPTKSLWHVVACMDLQNPRGMWWPVWSHKITGGMWWPCCNSLFAEYFILHKLINKTLYKPSYALQI